MRQAIIWTFAYEIHWRIYTAQGGDGLRWPRDLPSQCGYFQHLSIATHTHNVSPPNYHLSLCSAYLLWKLLGGPKQRYIFKTLRWRHNGRDSISNHQPYDCLLNRLFRRRWTKTPKLRATGLCAGNSPRTGEFPAQMVNNAKNVCIWWRHHELKQSVMKLPENHKSIEIIMFMHQSN